PLCLTWMAMANKFQTPHETEAASIREQRNQHGEHFFTTTGAVISERLTLKFSCRAGCLDFIPRKTVMPARSAAAPGSARVRCISQTPPVAGTPGPLGSEVIAD